MTYNINLLLRTCNTNATCTTNAGYNTRITYNTYNTSIYYTKIKMKKKGK